MQIRNRKTGETATPEDVDMIGSELWEAVLPARSYRHGDQIELAHDCECETAGLLLERGTKGVVIGADARGRLIVDMYGMAECCVFTADQIRLVEKPGDDRSDSRHDERVAGDEPQPVSGEIASLRENLAAALFEIDELESKIELQKEMISGLLDLMSLLNR